MHTQLPAFLGSTLFFALATSCVADRRLQANDHSSLFWSGRVNIDPRSAARRAAQQGGDVTWRSGIEIEVSGVNDLARTTEGAGQVEDYSSFLGTVAWSPEFWVNGWFGMSAQIGLGVHDSDISRVFGTAREPSSESGMGAFTAVQLAVKPLSFLQAYGRAGAYGGGDFSSRFSELGIKLGIDDSAWLFAAWRRAELAHEELAISGPDFDRVEVETDGLSLGLELRF